MSNPKKIINNLKISNLLLIVINTHAPIRAFAKYSKIKSVCSIILFGTTGMGKSTLANRLCLDFSQDGNEGPHKTSDGAASCTSKTQHNAIADNKNNIIVVVDTPGLSDSHGKDDSIITELFEYFKDYCIGRKIICMPIIEGRVRFDREIRLILELLYILFGKSVWKQLFIIRTRIDAPLDDIEQKTFNESKRTFVREAKQQINHFDLDDTNILPFGRYNYIPTFKKLYESVVKAEQIEGELLELILKYNLSSNCKEMLQCQGSIITFFKNKIADEEKKLNDAAKARKEKLESMVRKIQNNCIIL